MPSPTLPADCRVETLAEFLHDHRHGEESWAFLLASGRDNGNLVETYRDLARAVRALLVAKVVEAIDASRAGQFWATRLNVAQDSADSIVSRVLGSPS